MRVAVGDGNHDADAVRPPRLEPLSMARGGRLFVEVPGLQRPPALDLVVGGHVVQTVHPHRDGGYNLRRVLDTTAARSEAVLRLLHGGRTATVAWILNTASPQDPWLPHADVSGPD